MTIDKLEFPELPWKNKQQQLALEIGIDLLPDQFKGKWIRVIHEFTADWIKKHKFTGRGTLWMWTSPSVNLSPPENGMPHWSEFISLNLKKSSKENLSGWLALPNTS